MLLVFISYNFVLIIGYILNQLICNNHTKNFYNYITKLLNECNAFYFNVAFINSSGIQLLVDSFKLLEKKGIKGKIITSTYLEFTEVKALEKILEFSNIELKIYNKKHRGFHSKAYIFEFDDSFKTIIGSSNITASAFKSNVEWNVQSINKKDDLFLKEIFLEFNKLYDEAIYVNEEFLKSYSEYKNQNIRSAFEFEKSLNANYMQEKALEKLQFLRRNNEKKALVLAATGTGKTYLAAFDVKNSNAKKVLFLAHRENILIKSKHSFSKIISNKTMGLFSGNKKELEKEYIFSTVQSMSKSLGLFKKDEFDYIIVDEAHHIPSKTYKSIIDYFECDFLLGLTATSNRMDNESIFEYFDENIACDIRLNDALKHDLIVPFHYYGISDIEQIDYENINLKQIDKLAKLLMINRRVDFIIEQMKFYSYDGAKRKALAFCVSKEHAFYMSEEFNRRGVPSICLSSDDSILKREEYIKKLEDDNNKLQVIFTIDIFNEGIDIPSINTVLMLRPTDSSIVFIQQLGRGLRKHKNKSFLTILDFIGNHNKAYLIAMALVGNRKIDKESVKLSVLNNFANIPNAHISFDEICKHRILEQINEENFNSIRYLKEEYFNFKSYLNKTRIKLCDYMLLDDFNLPLKFIDYSKSYIEFLQKVEKNKDLDELCLNENFIKAIRFIESLFPIKRVYEFVILKYLLEHESCHISTIENSLAKYLEKISKDTISHSFSFLNQEFFDKAQISRYLKLVELKKEKLYRTKEFENILSNGKMKEFLEDSITYGILAYEKSFGLKDYSLPFLKLYEKYNMLNIAQLCNFNKIHSSFRGSGFLKFKDDFFLFISIEKDKFLKASKYVNDFISKEEFTFVSKPAHSYLKGDGLRLCENKKHNVKLHIFVRKFVQVDKKTQGFIYLGLANTVSYKGDKPIRLNLKLETALSDELYEEFTKIV